MQVITTEGNSINDRRRKKGKKEKREKIGKREKKKTKDYIGKNRYGFEFNFPNLSGAAPEPSQPLSIIESLLEGRDFEKLSFIERICFIGAMYKEEFNNK